MMLLISSLKRIERFELSITLWKSVVLTTNTIPAFWFWPFDNRRAWNCWFIVHKHITRFELVTCYLASNRSNQLSYMCVMEITGLEPATF